MKPETALILICLGLILLAFITGAVLDEARAFTGCALSSCPQSLQDWHYKNGGMRYYSDYEKDSPEYYRAYCNQMMYTEFGCK